MITKAKKKLPGPVFVQYFGPILDALRELGGSGRPAEIQDIIAEKLGISEQEQSEQLKSGASRFTNKIYWARFYLVKAGLLDSSTRGVWSITDAGRQAKLDHDAAYAIFKRIHAQWGVSPHKKGGDEEPDVESADAPPTGVSAAGTAPDHRSQLLALLKKLPPKGFEQLCQRLLRESGFEQVFVTGRSGDGGIDGHGLLQVNPLVSFRTYFQCKRYQDSVGPGVVRDFRGAMMGRADKGIILTTGTFTSEARKEAVRDGAPPIELVDGERLLDMFEELELGLKPKKSFDVDASFFDEFQKA